MIPLIVYYLVLPFAAFALLLKVMRKFGKDEVPREIRDLYAAHPIEKRSFRALRVDGRLGQPPVALAELGDFEKQEEAVDAAFEAKTKAAGTKASFLVLNDKGEILQEV
jgi:hypothetical protein